MKNFRLLPNSWRKWGWVILLPSIALGLAMKYYVVEPQWLNFSTEPFDFRLWHDDFIGHASSENLFNELITSTLLIGLLLICFTKEKKEDELIASIRLESLLWAVLINSLLLFVANLTLYGGVFLSFLMYNMFTSLIIYFLRFRYLIYQLKKD